MTQLHRELQHAKTTRDLRYSYSNAYYCYFFLQTNRLKQSHGWIESKFKPQSI